MKKLIVLVLVLSFGLAGGCATAGRNTGPGVLLGSVLGAGAGAIIGHQTGNAEGGALLGAGLGALTGGLVGSSLDRMEEDIAYHEAETAAAVRERHYVQGQLSILDVIRMSQAEVSDTIIIAKIDQSGSYFDLSASEIIDLQLSDVSDTVIEHILYRGSPSQTPLVSENSTLGRESQFRGPPVAIGINLGYSDCR
jgi:hypothetical protein